MREKEDELALFLEIAAMNRSFRAEETGFARRKPPERTGSLRTSVMREKEDELALFLEIAAMNRSFRAEETGFAHRKPPERTGSLRTSVMGEKEDELALFLEMRKCEKERNSLLNNSDEFDAPLGQRSGSSPIFNLTANGSAPQPVPVPKDYH